MGLTTIQLLNAAERGFLEQVKDLLDEGANVNAGDSIFKQTALMKAASNGYLKVVELLLDRGADINAKDQQSTTALMYAASDGRLEVVKLLLERGADANIPSGWNGWTALEHASGKDRQAIFDLLKAHGAKE